MNRAPAEEYLLEKMLSLDPEQFEQLCKMMLERAEKTKDPKLTPFQRDGGIDVQALIDRHLFYVDLGVQAKRYDPSNTIGGPTIQRFAGALGSRDFNVGAFITTSSFTGPAVTESEQAQMPIRLVDGEALTNILFEYEIGVTEDVPGSYAQDHRFWDAFETPEDTDVIPSLEVPQADSITTLQYVLYAIGDGCDTKHAIEDAVAPKMGGFDARQADYYGIAGWLLGFLHKEQRVQSENGEIRRWGVTRRGAEYLEYLQHGNTTGAEVLLQTGIREVEIINRILARLDTERVMTRKAVTELIEAETELNGTTAGRRESSVRSWIAALPEVTIERSASIEYHYTP